MSLSEREQHELRQIERALYIEDPALAELFSTPLDPTTRFVRKLAGVFVAVVVVLIAGGLILGDSGLILGGCLVLLMMPITVCLVATARRPAR